VLGRDEIGLLGFTAVNLVDGDAGRLVSSRKMKPEKIPTPEILA